MYVCVCVLGIWLIKIVLENVFHRHRSRALLATGNDDTDGVTLALKEANDKTSGPLRYVCLHARYHTNAPFPPHLGKGR